jgi:hypothetical protein
MELLQGKMVVNYQDILINLFCGKDFTFQLSYRGLGKQSGGSSGCWKRDHHQGIGEVSADGASLFRSIDFKSLKTISISSCSLSISLVFLQPLVFLPV